MSTLSDDERAVTSCLTDALRHVDDVIAGLLAGGPGFGLLDAFGGERLGGTASWQNFILWLGGEPENGSMEDCMAKKNQRRI